MCHDRTNNNKINRLHERCLRIVHKYNKSSFQELLDKCKGVTIHVKNVPAFAVEMFKGALSGLRQFLATESPLKMMKNAFYFTSKALFVLKIFKFLS